MAKRQSSQLNASDPFSLARMGFELWLAAFTTVAIRSQLLAAPLSTDRQLLEWHRMVAEKIAASSEMFGAMQRASFDWWSGSFDPWRTTEWMLTPMHSRATANAKRLTRRRYHQPRRTRRRR